MYFKHLPVKTCLTYLFRCRFYLPYINLIPSGIFGFSNEEDEQILRLRLYYGK